MLAATIPPMLRERPTTVLVIGYETVTGQAVEAVEAFASTLASAGLDVPAPVLVTATGWRHLDCTCCPSGGHPLPPAEHPSDLRWAPSTAPHPRTPGPPSRSVHHRPVDLRRPLQALLRRDGRGRGVAGHLRRPRSTRRIRPPGRLRRRPRPDRPGGHRRDPPLGRHPHRPTPARPGRSARRPPRRRVRGHSCGTPGGSDRSRPRSSSRCSTPTCPSPAAALTST